MNRENDDMANDSSVKLEKKDSNYSSDEKLAVFSSFITVMQRSVEKDETIHDDPVHEIQVFKRIEKLLNFYLQKMEESAEKPDNNLNFTGNLLINKNHQDINFIVKNLDRIINKKYVNVMIIDMEKVVLNLKEFLSIQDAFFEYIALNHSVIILIRNFDLLLIRSKIHDQNSSLRNVITKFLSFLKTKEITKERNIALAFIDSLEGMVPSLMSLFDYHVDLALPTREDRDFFLKYLFINEVDVNFSIISKEMENWTWNDIENFAKHVIFEQTTNSIEKISTKFLLDLLFGENNFEKFIPPSKKMKGKAVEQELIEAAISKTIDAYSSGAGGKIASRQPTGEQGTTLDDPFKKQLWQVAASKDYDAILKALDNLEKGIIEEEGRVLFSRYPFIIMEEPFDAKKKLDSSKKKLELINKNFKTGSEQ
ncbi:MAG: hypothetical protein ACFFCS_10180 [Candidatus Hodarchaeota archaeon]